MGVIDRFIGVAPTVTALGSAASGMAEIFTQNATRKMELNEEAYARAMSQYGQEFVTAPRGWFDSFVNGLNRMPRPMLALGTMALFIYAMIDPAAFSLRMQGLQLVPEPLWWLLGAIVGFYFGAREAHHFRDRVWPSQPAAEAVAVAATVVVPSEDFADNAALRDWAATLRE